MLQVYMLGKCIHNISSVGVFLGRPFTYDIDGVHTVRYNAGGPGYVLDNVALKVSIACVCMSVQSIISKI